MARYPRPVSWNSGTSPLPGTVLPDAPKDREGHPVDITGRRIPFARPHPDRDIRAALGLQSSLPQLTPWFTATSADSQILPGPQGSVSIASPSPSRFRGSQSGRSSSTMVSTDDGTNSADDGSYYTVEEMLSQNNISEGGSSRNGAGRPQATSTTVLPSTTKDSVSQTSRKAPKKQFKRPVQETLGETMQREAIEEGKRQADEEARVLAAANQGLLARIATQMFGTVESLG